MPLPPHLLSSCVVIWYIPVWRAISLVSRGSTWAVVCRHSAGASVGRFAGKAAREREVICSYTRRMRIALTFLAKYAIGRLARDDAIAIMLHMELFANDYIAVVKCPDGSLYRPTFNGGHRVPKGYYRRWAETHTWIRKSA